MCVPSQDEISPLSVSEYLILGEHSSFLIAMCTSFFFHEKTIINQTIIHTFGVHVENTVQNPGYVWSQDPGPRGPAAWICANTTYMAEKST